MQILRVPFGKGLDQRTDDRLNDPERPRATSNLQRNKAGRLVPRPGYDALPRGLNTSSVAAGNAFLTDIYSYRGDRLVGLGYGTGAGALPRPARPTDLYEYRPDLGNGIDWRQTDGDYQGRLCSVTHLRDLPSLPEQTGSSFVLDCAAGNGIVAIVYISGGGNFIFYATDAATGRTVHVEKLTGTACKLCCIDGVFFVAAQTDSSTDISLWSYDPAVDTELQALTNAHTGATQVQVWDLAANQAGDGFTVALCVVSGSVVIRLFDGDGALADTISTSVPQPSSLTVLSQAGRTHLAYNTSGTVDLDTYEHSGGTLENSTELTTGGQSTAPAPVLALVSEEPSEERIVTGITLDSFDGVLWDSREPDTHANSTTQTWFNALLGSKPLGSQQGVEFDQLLFGGQYLDTASARSNFIGAFQVILGPQRLEAYADRLIAGTPSNGLSPTSMAYDASTGLAYWARLAKGETGLTRPLVAEFNPAGTERRQTGEIGGCLYLAQGFMQYFDGLQLVDSAFAQTPRVKTANGVNGSGTLTADGSYQVTAVWRREDALRNVQQSAPANVFEVTLSGSEDTIQADVTTPFAPERSSTNEEYGGTVRTEVFATSDTNTNGGDPSLHFALGSSTEANDYGEESTFNVLGPDATLEEQRFLYTQADDGVISGSLPYDAPRPCSALAVSADRITTVGLIDHYQLQESMPLFPARALTWSDAIGFRRSAHAELLAVSRQDERRFAFTRDGVYSFSGPGLDPNGNGDIGPPQAMPSDVGLQGGKLGWRSMVAWAKGIMFQGTDGLIYNLPRGGGAPEAVGEMVQDLTAAYPVITSAILDRAGQRIRFTCNNEAGDDGIVLVFDTVDGEWFSEGPFGEAIQSAAMYGDRYCMLRNGIVYRQRESGSATFIATSWGSSWLRPNSPGGWLSLGKVWIYGEMLGDCTVTPTLTFSDGTTEVLPAKTVSTSPGADLERAVGTEVTLEWTPNRVQCEAVRVDWAVTALSGAATRGIAYTFFGLEYESHSKGAMRLEEEIA